MPGERLMALLCLALAIDAPPVRAAGDAERGRAVAIEHCARCHVVGDYNRTGGLDSTPSFQWLKRMRDYRERIRTFFARPPHPVFVRVAGVAPLSNAPPYAMVFEVTHEQVEDILAFVETLPTPQ